MNTNTMAISHVLDTTRTDSGSSFVFSSHVGLVDRVVPQACEYLEERGMDEFGPFK